MFSIFARCMQFRNLDLTTPLEAPSLTRVGPKLNISKKIRNVQAGEESFMALAAKAKQKNPTMLRAATSKGGKRTAATPKAESKQMEEKLKAQKIAPKAEIKDVKNLKIVAASEQSGPSQNKNPVAPPNSTEEKKLPKVEENNDEDNSKRYKAKKNHFTAKMLSRHQYLSFFFSITPPQS